MEILLNLVKIQDAVKFNSWEPFVYILSYPKEQARIFQRQPKGSSKIYISKHASIKKLMNK